MSDVLLPLLVVLGVALVVPSANVQRRWVSAVLVLGGWVVVGRYLHWRLTETVLPASGSAFETGVVWVVFLVECLAWAESAILAAVLLRRTDRSAEADAHETRLRATPPGDLPAVDVFIATYNEPREVLEKSIAGAMALDWPADRLRVHVLDDGRRDWLAAYCRERGVNHLTRGDNRHAKAGNINAALARTDAPFILVLDADFVPLRPMLMRAIGFFDDPRVGIVQMPHHFFNSDPVQASLDLDAHLPDEQRLFFDVIQPGRDGWDCAFCCGSNGILRREAVEAIGGAMPTSSITEDMLLTLTMLRQGYITRYLAERLAIGLAPENLDAYFLQRGRWAQGAIQIMYLDDGPLGPGLTLVQRILFLPSHWISQSICLPVAISVPAFFLLTGVPPIVNATTGEILHFQVPAVVAGFALMRHLAPEKFAPLSATAQALLQAFRIAPAVFAALVRPRGQAFRVTPKGAEARRAREDRHVLGLSYGLIALTGTGLAMNAIPEFRIVDAEHLLPVVAFWAVVNMIVLLLVASIAIPRPRDRQEERFVVRDPVIVQTEACAWSAVTEDLSLSGARISFHGAIPERLPQPGGWLLLGIGPDRIPARVVRRVDGAVPGLALSFDLAPGPARDGLIRRLFASGAPLAHRRSARPVSLTAALLWRIFKPDVPPRAAPPSEAPGLDEPPAWILARIAAQSSSGALAS